VFRSPDAAHLGYGGGHERQTRAVPSATGVARLGSASDDRRLRTASRPRALQREPDRIGRRFLLILYEVKPLSTTRHECIGNV